MFIWNSKMQTKDKNLNSMQQKKFEHWSQVFLFYHMYIFSEWVQNKFGLIWNVYFIYKKGIKESNFKASYLFVQN